MDETLGSRYILVGPLESLLSILYSPAREVGTKDSQPCESFFIATSRVCQVLTHPLNPFPSVIDPMGPRKA
ncbi:hypothetical protein RAS2_20690 [Phycisphaerae bacterium RAS2]|nr:hypothetical protein RAS2_20690 [Phycisphaerae bacterium RAS2]